MLDVCRRDLDGLESWGVLISEQDISSANTLEEFLRASRRYQISESGRTVERLARELESGERTRGSLDATRVRRLHAALLRMHERLEVLPETCTRDQLAEIEGEWNAIEDTRAQIDEQARRYLSELGQWVEITPTDLEVFLEYKRLLRDYVGAFLKELSPFRRACTNLFDTWKRNGLDQRLVRVLVENEISRKGDLRGEAELTRIQAGAVRRLMGLGGDDGTGRILERKTAARFGALIAQIERMVLERGNVVDRKRDLERLALAFRAAPTDDAAARLAATAFDWGCPEHLFSHGGGEGEVNDEESVWRQAPVMLSMRANTRGNPRFGRVTPIADRSLERARLRAERARMREFWNRFFEHGAVTLASVDLADAAALNRVARLVRDCIRSPDRDALLEDGTRVRLHLPADLQAVGEIRTPGGIYYTRPFVLTREEVVA